MLTRYSRSTFPERSSAITTDERLTAAYDYDLPQALIAQHPAAERDASRLMVLEGAATQHRRFGDLPSLLKSGDLLVLNETRVVRARLLGHRAGGGGAELLLLHPAGSMRYDASARTLDRADASRAAAASRRSRIFRCLGRGHRRRGARRRDARSRASTARSLRIILGGRRTHAAAAIHSQRIPRSPRTLSDGFCPCSRKRRRADRIAAFYPRTARASEKARG